MSKHKFKIGDRVRCIDPTDYEYMGLKEGAVGTVAKDFGGDGIGVTLHDGTPTGYIFARRFEKIEDTGPPRKGDKVRVVIKGEVIAVNGDGTLEIGDATGEQIADWIPGDHGDVTIDVTKRAEPEVTEFRAGDLVEYRIGSHVGGRYMILAILGERNLIWRVGCDGPYMDAPLRPENGWRLVSRNWDGLKEIGKGSA